MPKDTHQKVSWNALDTTNYRYFTNSIEPQLQEAFGWHSNLYWVIVKSPDILFEALKLLEKYVLSQESA